MKPSSYGLPLLLMAHKVHHRKVDGFAHPMFQSYHTYPIAQRDDSSSHYDPRGSRPLEDHSSAHPPSIPSRWEEEEGTAEASSSHAFLPPQQQPQVQALQRRVDSLLDDRSRLEEQLRALEHDYVVDVTALADRLELLLDRRPEHPLDTTTSSSLRRVNGFNNEGDDVHSPRPPLVEFHVREGEDSGDDDEEDDDVDVDVDLEHVARVEQSFLTTLSTKGMLRAQQASLRARFRQLKDGVRSTFRGESSSPNAGGGRDDEVVVTIEECIDPNSYDG